MLLDLHFEALESSMESPACPCLNRNPRGFDPQGTKQTFLSNWLGLRHRTLCNIVHLLQCRQYSVQSLHRIFVTWIFQGILYFLLCILWNITEENSILIVLKNFSFSGSKAILPLKSHNILKPEHNLSQICILAEFYLFLCYLGLYQSLILVHF